MDYTDRIEKLQQMLKKVNKYQNNIEDTTTSFCNLDPIDSSVWSGSKCSTHINDYVSNLKEEAKTVCKLSDDIADTIRNRIVSLKTQIENDVQTYSYMARITKRKDFSKKRDNINNSNLDKTVKKRLVSKLSSNYNLIMGSGHAVR